MNSYNIVIKKEDISMQYAIIFSSPTGNTQMLAETIKNHIKGECCYYGKADLAPLMADYIL